MPVQRYVLLIFQKPTPRVEFAFSLSATGTTSRINVRISATLPAGGSEPKRRGGRSPGLNRPKVLTTSATTLVTLEASGCMTSPALASFRSRLRERAQTGLWPESTVDRDKSSHLCSRQVEERFNRTAWSGRANQVIAAWNKIDDADDSVKLDTTFGQTYV